MTMPNTQGGGRDAGVGTDQALPDGPKQHLGDGRRCPGQIRQVKDQVVDQAKTTFRDARDRAGSSLSQGRRQAADQIGGIASAFHSAGEHLRRSTRSGSPAWPTRSGVRSTGGRLPPRRRPADRPRRRESGPAPARAGLRRGVRPGHLGARFLKSSERRARSSTSDEGTDGSTRRRARGGLGRLPRLGRATGGSMRSLDRSVRSASCSVS